MSIQQFYNIYLELIEIFQMDHQYQKILAESKILHTFTSFLLFQYIDKKKKQIAEGNCLILQSHLGQLGTANTFIKMNNVDYLKKINDNLFVRIKYQTSTAYLFSHETNQNVVYAITMFNKSAQLPQFDQLLSERAILIQYDSPSLKLQDKQKIDLHCQNIRENQVVFNFNTIAKVGKTMGNFLGIIGQKFTKSTAKIQQAFNSKVEDITRQSTKWQSIKQKASKLNDKMTELIKPVSEMGNSMVDKIGDSYNKSQNSIVKSIRQLSKQTQNSINQGFAAELNQVSQNGGNDKPLTAFNQTYQNLDEKKIPKKSQTYGQE